MTDIMVTMPDLKKEGNKALKEFYKKEKGHIYFRVSKLPKECRIGEYCHIICNGECIGKHKIIDLCFVHEKEAQELSDGNWHEGNYIIREANSFIADCCKVKIKGFQGFRYV
jgi:hypothetical protein